MSKKKNTIQSLDQIEKKQPFKVEEAYFDTLQARVFERLDAAGENRTKGLHFLPGLWQVKYAAAASLTILFISALSIYYFTQPGTPEYSFEQGLLSGISEEEIIEYLATTDLSYHQIARNADHELTLESMEKLPEQERFSEEEAEALFEYYNL